MRNTGRRIAIFILVVVLIPVASLAGTSEEDLMKAKHKCEGINLMEKETLNRLFEDSAPAKELFNKSYGYAVFDNVKVSLGISGGGGSGVAVRRDTEKRTYMNMGTAGLNLGLGGQKYQVVFMFQTEKAFKDFVDKGWRADAGANAVAGKEGANIKAEFVNGLAIYQMTEAGLMLQADISGTKYWKNDKLNALSEEVAKSENEEEAKKDSETKD